MDEQVLQASAFLKDNLQSQAKIALILGSGLGGVVDQTQVQKRIPYPQIPCFPCSTIQGHRGAFVLTEIQKRPVYALEGRFHYYEGKSLKEVTFPIRVLRQLGVKMLIVTNAAGIINEKFKPGEFMMIADHINLMGDNPLRGPNWDSWGPRFPNLTHAYDPKLIRLALTLARQRRFRLRKGVYAGVSGPSYETPSEIGMLKMMGADAVGMSTVPEVIVANHQGTRVCGFSCLTNYTSGHFHKNASHEEVLAVSQRVTEKFGDFLKKFIVAVDL